MIIDKNEIKSGIVLGCHKHMPMYNSFYVEYFFTFATLALIEYFTWRWREIGTKST